MKIINFRRVFIAVGLTGLVTIYIVLWVRMITTPAERTGADFIGFYSAARIAQNEGAGQIYIPEVQQKIEQQQVGFELAPGQVLLFNHLPYLVPLLCLLVNGNYVASFIRWTVILLFLVCIDTGVLLAGMKRLDFRRGVLLVLAAGTLSFYPMFTSLMNGQDTVFLLLGGAIWLFGCLYGKDALAGLGLALMTIRPQLALILALPFLFKRRKVFFWFLIVAALMGVFVILFLGQDGTRNFLHVLAISARGDWYGLHPEAMPTLTGLLHWLFPGQAGGAIQIAGLVGYFLTTAGLCLMWFKSKDVGYMQISLAVILGVFFIPYLHYHDLTLLLVPVYCLIQVSSPSKRRLLVILPLAISFFLLVGSFWRVTTFLTVFLVMIGLAYFLWNPAWVSGNDRSVAQS
jgi:Glycosyltransferase family 87